MENNGILEKQCYPNIVICWLVSSDDVIRKLNPVIVVPYEIAFFMNVHANGAATRR